MPSLRLNEQQQQIFKFWLPSLLTGLLAWLLLFGLGETPFIRATGLALVIVGVSSALRRMGAAIAAIGSLTLALSPVFWSQTGGGVGSPATIVIALAAAGIAVLLAAFLTKRPYIGLGLGILVFAVFFWSQIGTEGSIPSIRLTSFIISWLMFVLVDMLLLTNPRPEDAPQILRDGHSLKNPDGSEPARPYHSLGILLLLAVGILNDPLLTLLAPSIALSLYLSKTRLPVWYWLGLGLIFGFGLRGIALDYLTYQAPYVDLLTWRDAYRWIDMVNLLNQQFTVLGILLGVLGLARLARWYPPLGSVTLLGFAAYWFFGLVYTGVTRDILLLPLYVIFVLWMSYAVLALSEWFSRLYAKQAQTGRYLAIALYACLPLLFLWSIWTNKF